MVTLAVGATGTAGTALTVSGVALETQVLSVVDRSVTLCNPGATPVNVAEAWNAPPSRLYSYAPVLICACWCSDDDGTCRNRACWLNGDRSCRCDRHSRHCINGEWCCARDASIICCGSVGDIMQSRSDAR